MLGGIPIGRSSSPGESAKRVFALDDPVIHLLRNNFLRRWMDARIKSGHDM
jgi:hypothetical protein